MRIPRATCWLPIFLFAIVIGNQQDLLAEPIYWEATQLRAMQLASEHAQPDKSLKKLLARLRIHANDALDRGPYSVMNKQDVPPSGDKHDYMSFSRYWWPDPEQADGLPYIRRDGEVNVKSRKRGDRDEIGQLFEDVETLGLAYYFLGEQKYATHVAELIRSWFLAPETRMNPHMKFGQGVPGRAVGRGVGILDTRGFIKLLDSLELISSADAVTAKERQQLKDWFAEYLQWLRNSELGKKEAGAENNHGSWYAAQAARIALFVGEDKIARDIVQKVLSERIAYQFAADGSQPAELKRTQSLHYSFFNLEALSIVARVGEHLGVDIWKGSAAGKGLQPGIQFLLPYVSGEKQWPYPQMPKFAFSSRAINLLRRASARFDDPKYLKPIATMPRRHASRIHSQLLFRAAVDSNDSPQGAVVTVSDEAFALDLDYTLPDLTEFTPQSTRKNLPGDYSGTASVGPTEGERILSETFRKDRLPGFKKRQGTAATQAIKLEGGAITLREVVRQIDDEAVLSAEGSVVTVRLPILIKPGASLIIDGQDTAEVRLSTDRGALVANAGRLYVIDAVVTSWDEQESTATTFRNKQEFRPFLASYIRSQTYLAGSTFRHLGYHAPTSYGVSLSSQPERENPRKKSEWPTGSIIGCQFEGLYYGFYSFEARGVTILDSKYTDSIVYGIDPHDRSTELVIARNTTTGTREKHGIIGSRGVCDSYIFANRSYGNNGSGIMLDRQCNGNVICNNKVYRNGQGIAIYESSANVIANNLLVENKKSGIRVRNSEEIVLASNRVVGNGDYGIEVSAKRLDDHAKRTGRNDEYVEAVEVTMHDQRVSLNRRGIIKGNNVSYLGMSQILTDVDLSNVEAEVGLKLNSVPPTADTRFGSGLKPYAEQLGRVFDEGFPQVVFRQP